MLKTLTLAAALPLLAQLSGTDGHLPDPQSWQILGWAVMVLFGLFGLANQGIDLWRKVFPKDGADESRFATKEQLAALEENLNQEVERIDETLGETCGRIERRFSQWLTDMHNELKQDDRLFQDWKAGVERVIGRLEAILPASKKH